MILNKEIEISRKGNSKLNFYKNLGYDVESSKFLIKIEHLPDNSHTFIDVECDSCFILNKLTYKDYNRFNTFPMYFCPNCKRKNTNLEKYGVEFVSKLESSKIKVKKTNLEKYGVEHALQSKEIIEKVKKTNLEKYGVENIFQCDKIKEKIKETNFIKYGVDSYSKTNEYIDKIKETSLLNWGVTHPSKSEIIKKKKYESNLEKYGYNTPSKSDIVKEKSKETFNSKWGGFTLCSDILINKVRNTNLEKYGVDSYSKTNEYIDKVRSTNLEKYGVDHIRKSDIYRNDFKITNDVNYIKYLSSEISLFKCDLGINHHFEINSGNYLDRKRYKIPICTVCNPIGDLKSIKEKELFRFIKSVYSGEVIQSYRDGLEIDIYIPELKIGFEFNGLYYHSNRFKENDYHLNKSNYFKERGIRIIHIWEDDWDNKVNIVSSQIENWLGLTPNKIFARKCYISEIKDSKLVTKFLEENHIQGRVNSNLKLGLYHDGDLVSLMTFDHLEGRKKMSESEWNINRFCNKLDTYVVGGASKLLKYFIKNYDVTRIISYSDNDWSLGSLYKNLGFTIVNQGIIDYKYLLDGRRVHKSRFRKSKTGISEKYLNFLKVYDCGKTKWEINI